MNLRGRLNKLENEVQQAGLAIPQKDGSVARFTQSQLKEAFLCHYDSVRAIANGDVPPEPHPLQRAIRNAAFPQQWHGTFFDVANVEEGIEDLSE